MFLSVGITLLAVCVVAEPPSADGVRPGAPLLSQTDVRPVDHRLADSLVANARVIFSTDPLSVEGWQAATAFLLDATRIDDDHQGAWRLLADVALEQDNSELLERSIKRLVVLDPRDTAARLTRLFSAMDALQTAPAQADMLRQLLHPDRVAFLGPDVGAELAMHLATLERQMGNIDVAGTWVTKAAELDPSNAKLIAMQLGLSHVENDPVRWANGLIALMKANPADRDTVIRLGNLLLEHGDPRGAARFLALARDLALAAGRDAGAELDADLALSLMLTGRRDEAQSVLTNRRIALDEMYQQIVKPEDGVRRSPLETARLHAPLPPKLAGAGLLLAATSGEQALLDQAAADFDEALKWNDIQLKQEGQSDAVRALPLRLGIRLAAAAGVDRVQLGDMLRTLEALDVEAATEQEFVAAADAADAGRVEEAMAALRTLAANDSAAQIALARHLEAAGERKAAALELLAVHRAGPGTFLGALSSLRLEALLGQPLPLESPAIELEQATIAVPAAWDRYGREPTLAVAMRLKPMNRTVELYGPLILELELFNHLEVPLVIASDGPIGDLVLLKPEVQRPYSSAVPDYPILVDIGRRLRLEPHERLTISVNLREYWVGAAVNDAALVGATLEVMGVLNPRIATAPASGASIPVPGALGMFDQSGQIHVEGRRVEPVEIGPMCARLLSRSTDRELKDMALLGNMLEDVGGTELRAPLTEAQRQQVNAALSEKWARLSVNEQAWLVTALPVSEDLGSFGDLIAASAEPLIQRLLLMRIGSGVAPEKALDDPRLIAALRSPDSSVYTLAMWIESFMRLAAESKFDSGG